MTQLFKVIKEIIIFLGLSATKVNLRLNPKFERRIKMHQKPKLTNQVDLMKLRKNLKDKLGYSKTRMLSKIDIKNKFGLTCLKLSKK